MDINIKGDPGTGNSYTEIKMEKGAIYQNLPNVTEVTNVTNNYMYGKMASGIPQTEEEKQILKDSILEYVNKLKDEVAEDWKKDYGKLWLDILAVPEIEENIYNPGRQDDTRFNRNLVGNIIGFLKTKSIYKKTTAKKLAEILEGNPDSSVRGQIGVKLPIPTRNTIEDIIKTYGK